MKLTSISVQNSNLDEVMSLSFRDPGNQNPYIAKAITGLDGDELIPKFYGVSKVSKQNYFNLSMQARQIVLRIALNPNFSDNTSYSNLRDEVYKAIASSRTGIINLVFMNGVAEIAHISGFVVKFEAPLTKIPEIQVTIRCDDPTLKAPIELSAPVAFGDHSEITVNDTQSTAPHGFRASYTFTDDSLEWLIKDLATPEWEFKLIPGYAILGEEGFFEDDVLYFSSNFNERSITLTRDAETIEIGNKIQPGSIWPILFPGVNEFLCTDVGEWTSINYHPTYWGV